MQSNTSDAVSVPVDEGLMLEIPRQWKRSAVVVYSSDDEPEKGASIVIRRESIDPRTELSRHVDDTLVELARTLPEFTLIERLEREIDGKPASELRYTMKVRGTTFHQSLCCVLDIPGSALSITSTTHLNIIQGYQPLFDEIVGGAKLVTPHATPIEP